MGAGRKTITISMKEKSEDFWKVNGSTPARNLSKVELGAIIFGCKHSTMKECLENEIFGLPAGHYSYVKKATPGLTLFLFNYSDRKLHGIFEAVSTGQMNIYSYAWITTVEGAEATPYPAQVRIRARCRCRPLLEEEIKPIIANNYYTEKYFWFELDKEQTRRLTTLFQSSPFPVKTLRPSYAERKKNSFNIPSTSCVMKTADEEFGMDQSMLKENKHLNVLVSNRDGSYPGKKWSELFKPSSSLSAVNHAGVLEPKKVLNPTTSECFDDEWELASNTNSWGEIAPEPCYGAANGECDLDVVECWEESALVDNYVKEIFESSVNYQDECSGRLNTDMPSSDNMTVLDGWGAVKPSEYDSAQTEEYSEKALLNCKANNVSAITPGPIVNCGRECDQLNFMDEGVLTNVQSSHFLHVTTKEIEELKASQFNHCLKIETLEQELVNLKKEIHELKKRYQKLE